ncbi:hypothetical protein E2C01_047899 [Portunus trituberculatus]|uniref:Uncharacterized protein n=1 Tax=Portunus trituberculatus TaxID=210409 RepID=A0A5B7GBS8_PORTR|nr:hypothetical protein [Portunus trituberculatus]
MCVMCSDLLNHNCLRDLPSVAHRGGGVGGIPHPETVRSLEREQPELIDTRNNFLLTRETYSIPGHVSRDPLGLLTKIRNDFNVSAIANSADSPLMKTTRHISITTIQFHSAIILERTVPSGRCSLQCRDMRKYLTALAHNMSFDVSLILKDFDFPGATVNILAKSEMHLLKVRINDIQFQDSL